ncbi:MAG: hypothetical protein ACRC8S_22555 [Fimbriiglobus sp.]
MILQFPNLDTLRLILSGGIIPPEISALPARMALSEDGAISVEFEGKLPKKSTTEFTRLGTTTIKRHIGEEIEVLSWLQIFPVTRDPAPPLFTAQAPVLFELTKPADLPTIVGEMLRLGNDRQSVRRVSTGATERLYLRVIGPPYYTLLRAIDSTASGTVGELRAYVEAAPRVWVQLGYTHPFLSQLLPPDDQALFLRPERDWEFLPETGYQDVYEVLKFELPAAPLLWKEAPQRDKLKVPLRLVAGNAADQAEMWVLRGNSIEQLDAFVRDADDRITQRLKFAVAKDGAGQEIVVLRVTASKLAPPVLPLADVIGYKPFYKLPNLFMPAGSRLHPMLRRDAVRKLLADDTDQLVWLRPGPGGQFTPETMPEDSFRPLEEWVDYVLESNHAPVMAWIQASRFDFDSFICSESAAPKPKGPDDKDPKTKKKSKVEDDSPLTPVVSRAASKKSDKDDKPDATNSFVPIPLEVKAPSEWLARRQKLEDEFLGIEGELDHPDRQALWPDLAEANLGYGDAPEAALCWLNAMWGEKKASMKALERWVHTEDPNLPQPVRAVTFDEVMKPQDPTVSEFRRFASLALLLAYQNPLPGWFQDRLPKVMKYLEANEHKLPIRANWLLASKLYSLGSSDPLGLARVRDRALQRLLEEGLRPERDVPFFLRSAGVKDSDRVRQVRERALELYTHVKNWANKSLAASEKRGSSDGGSTLGYIELFFAYGMAKIGETDTARRMMDAGRTILEAFKPTEERGIAGRFLFEALQYRIEQAISSKPHAGPLSPEIIAKLDAIYEKSKSASKTDNPWGLGHYAAMRMRDQSLILEPQEKLDPYHEFMRETDDLRKALSEVPKLRDPAVLSKTVRELYRAGVNGKVTPDTKFLVLVNALPLAGRVGEQFTVELLSLVPDAMKGIGTGQVPAADLAEKQGKLLERALLLAANYDRRDLVQQLVDQFVELMRSKNEDQRNKLVNVVAGRCVRSLRKLGLRDDIDLLLRRMQDVILSGDSPEKLRDRFNNKPEQWLKSLQSLLNLAGGWLTFGLTEPAKPILNLARVELLNKNSAPQPKDYTPLAQAYIAAVGSGPADESMARLVELFDQMEPARVQNSFTTSKFYSRFHLNIVEEVVMALVNDDFSLGSAGRRWLDQDEFLIRRRIHADLRQAMAQQVV